MFGMTKGKKPHAAVMLNLFQHLVRFFLASADTPFIPVHRTGFSGANLITMNTSAPPSPTPSPARGEGHNPIFVVASDQRKRGNPRSSLALHRPLC
jgi:hypothetical protein